jgi:hypothetical protein
LSYLAIAKAAESRMRMARDPGAVLADLYRQFWTTPDREPKETFTAILAEISILEAQLDPGKVIGILEAAAQMYHRETGLCPYCRLAGPLHHGPEGHEG